MLFKKLITPGIRWKKNLISFGYSSSVYKEQKIKVDKWDINYIKVGRGSHNVLCLPGALGTIWTDFKYQIEGFDKDKFTLVVWDPPGYGKSRPPDKEFTADFFEKDADNAAELMEALKIPKYSVLGWSDGGTTSFIHAAKELRDTRSWSERMRKPFEEMYGKDVLTEYWAKWTDAVTTTVYNNDNGNICSQYLKDIKCPTFILYGEKDPIVDPSHTTYLLTHIAKSRLHLYPNGKHNIHINYAEDFNARVQEFLLLPS